jgi:hypothetical protein
MELKLLHLGLTYKGLSCEVLDLLTKRSSFQSKTQAPYGGMTYGVKVT